MQPFYRDQDEIRTRTPFGATPSKWCVYQFRHLAVCPSFRAGINLFSLSDN